MTRGRGGGLMLALALASCIGVTPAFARSPEVLPAAVATSPPESVRVEMKAPAVAVDSAVRFLVIGARAAIVTVRHDSVALERADSMFVAIRLVTDPVRGRTRLASLLPADTLRSPNTVRWRSRTLSETATARLNRRYRS